MLGNPQACTRSAYPSRLRSVTNAWLQSTEGSQVVRTSRVLGFMLCIAASAQAQFESLNSANSPLTPLPPIGLEGVDQPPINRHYDRDEDRALVFYKPKAAQGVSNPLVAIVRDTVLPGPSRDIYLDRFMQRLIDKGIAVVVLTVDRPERNGLRSSAAAVGSAFAYVRSNPQIFGSIGPSVLIGVGSGSSTVLLVSSDTSLWSDSESRRSIKMIVSINGVGFDGPATVARQSEYMSKRYLRIFGKSEEEQRQSSAAGHLGSLMPPVRFIDEERAGISSEGEKAASAIISAGGVATYRSTPWLTGKVKAAIFGQPANQVGNELLNDIIAITRP